MPNLRFCGYSIDELYQDRDNESVFYRFNDGVWTKTFADPETGHPRYVSVSNEERLNLPVSWQHTHNVGKLIYPRIVHIYGKCWWEDCEKDAVFIVGGYGEHGLGLFCEEHAHKAREGGMQCPNCGCIF
jgi:hypothetical protein